MRRVALHALLPALILLACPARGQEVEMVPGHIRAIKVEGTVWQIIKSSGQRERLKEGDFLRQGNAVVTAANGRVILLFQNGSTVNLQPGTRFSIDEFLVDPFEQEDFDYRKFKAEPSQSVTRLRVDEGTITSKVAKLDRGSDYDIKTPLGAAVIRGTVITLNSKPEADFYVVTEGEIEATKDGEAFWIAGGAAPNSGMRRGRRGSTEEQTIIISTDENYRPPDGEAERLAGMGQEFSDSVAELIPPSPFEGAPETDGSNWSTTDSGGNMGGSGGGSAPPLPGGFGGGGGGGGSGNSGSAASAPNSGGTGGGGIYSN